MAINASKPTKELIPAGTYAARCYKMIHIGTINEESFGEMKLQNKVFIAWELPEETKIFDPAKGPQPLSINQEFVLSLAKKSNFRKYLEGWRGKEFTEEEAKKFDVSALLGKPCMITITHRVSKTSGNEYQTISGITNLPKGFHMKPQINPNFHLDYDNFTEEAFNSLPDFLKEKMKGSKEFKKMLNHEEVAETESLIIYGGDDGGDLPF